MSSITTRASRNRGTVKSSENPICNRGKQKISKYFAKVTDLSDSPYQNVNQRNPQIAKSSDLDDFKTPEAINKVSKISTKVPPRATKRKKTKQIPLTKFVEDNLKQSDINPEHLQLALALSESSYEAENPQEAAASQSKRESFKIAFEKFGFGYSRNNLSVSNKKAIQKTNKKSKFRFITPILKIRTQEERDQLIQSKIALILAQNDQKPPPRINSQDLSSNRIFNLNRLELSELNSGDRFYVPGLAVERCCAPCGCLLKDWSKIPGFEDEKTNQNDLTRSTPTSNQDFDSFMLEGADDVQKQKMNEGVNSMNLQESIEQMLTSNLSTSAGNFNCSILVRHVDVASESQDFVSQSKIGDNLDVSGVELMSDENLNLNSAILEEGTDDATVQFRNDRVNVSGSDQTNERSFLAFNEASTSCEVSSNSQNPKTLKYQTPPHLNSSRKRSFSCVSPDLFESDEEPSAKLTPAIDRLRGGQDMEEIDLTQSDYEENQIKISQIEETSDLNVTDYIQNMLSQNYEKKLEKISSSEESQSSQDVIYISDDELNYSSVFSSSFTNKSKSNFTKQNLKSFSDDEIEKSPLAEKINNSGNNSAKSNLRLESPRKYNLSDDDYAELPLAGLVSKSEKSYFEDFRKQNLRLESPETYHFNEDDFIERLHPGTLSKSKNNSDDDSEKHPLAERTNKLEDNCLGQLSLDCPKTSNLSADDLIQVAQTCEFSEDELRKRPLAERINKLENNCVKRRSSLESPNTYNLSDDDLIQPPLAERIKSKKLEDSCQKSSLDDSLNQVLALVETPLKPLIIKTNNVTPMANYDEMDTPKIQIELDKFGLKPLRRQKGAKLLRYIYESTHPVVNENQPPKKTKLVFEGVTEGLDEEEVILEKRQLKKVASCAVPLHIAWYNFVMSNPEIRESILLYEPLQLEVLHAMLREQDFKFNIQDLLTFLDKKCITIRTAQTQHHKKNK